MEYFLWVFEKKMTVILSRFDYINGSLQKRRNAIAHALELRIPCIKPSVCGNIRFDSSVQDCSNSIAKALELLQSCTEPAICFRVYYHLNYRYVRRYVQRTSGAGREVGNESRFLFSGWVTSSQPTRTMNHIKVTVTSTQRHTSNRICLFFQISL